MKQLSSLNKYFWKYRRRFFLGITFVILTNYFRILSPQITGYVVNTVVKAIDNNALNAKNLTSANKNYDVVVRAVISSFEAQSFGNKILYAGIILIILAVISGLFMFLMRQTIIVMSRHIEYEQKNEIFDHYQKLDTQFYKTHGLRLSNPIRPSASIHLNSSNSDLSITTPSSHHPNLPVGPKSSTHPCKTSGLNHRGI